MGTGNNASPPLQQGWRGGRVGSQAEISLSKGHARLYLPSITSTELERSFWISSCLQNTQSDPCLLLHRFSLHPQVYTRYGKCYTFNGDRRNPRVTRQGGMGNGLEIMLDIQQEEYLPIWRETSKWGYSSGRAEVRGARTKGCWAGRTPCEGAMDKSGHQRGAGAGLVQACSTSVLLPQMRHHLKLASGSRSTARMSHPISIS